MPVPKRKTSKSKRDKRRSHHQIATPAIVTCTECGESMIRHRACPHCGIYRGRQVLEAAD